MCRNGNGGTEIIGKMSSEKRSKKKIAEKNHKQHKNKTQNKLKTDKNVKILVLRKRLVFLRRDKKRSNCD